MRLHQRLVPAERALGTVGLRRHHRQVAGGIAGPVVDPVHRARRPDTSGWRVIGHMQHLDLAQVVRRDLGQLEGAVAQPGVQPQRQPQPHAPRRAERALAEAGLAGAPALVQRVAVQPLLGRRQQAVAGMVPADVEADLRVGGVRIVEARSSVWAMVSLRSSRPAPCPAHEGSVRRSQAHGVSLWHLSFNADGPHRTLLQDRAADPQPRPASASRRCAPNWRCRARR